MDKKKLAAQIWLTGSEEAVEKAKTYSDNGIDMLILWDLSETDEEHEKNIGLMKEIYRAVTIPMIAGGNVKRVEDVKKYLYTGAKQAILNFGNPANIELLEAVYARFGKEKLAVDLPDLQVYEETKEALAEKVSLLLSTALPQESVCPVIVKAGDQDAACFETILKQDYAAGITADVLNRGCDCSELKWTLKAAGIPMHVLESAVPFAEFKLNDDGLLPVVVQDYKTSEVLMLAYMNKESYEQTLRTGKMTYYSRSRQELWIKGLTSGHFQYVKSLVIDCDKDTILAKVHQIGAACHTGSPTCFYTPLAAGDEKEKNPLKVFEQVYGTIMDRKLHPKKGSYTNYLFEKGLDKILKKVGEEATEIIIAAKNPDPEEIKYEMADFLYHAMVLMADQGITWDDIVEELANRE